MKKIIVLALVLSLMFAVSAFAAEKAAPGAPAAPAEKAPIEKPTMLKGKVEVAKDAAGKATGIALMTAEGKIDVAMDAKGKELEKLDGKNVEAMGVVAEKDGVKTITIHSVKAEMPKK